MSDVLQLKGDIPFPCHKKKRKLVFYGSHGFTSDACPQCGQFALFNLDTMESFPSRPAKGALNKRDNEIYRLSH